MEIPRVGLLALKSAKQSAGGGSAGAWPCSVSVPTGHCRRGVGVAADRTLLSARPPIQSRLSTAEPEFRERAGCVLRRPANGASDTRGDRRDDRALT